MYHRRHDRYYWPRYSYWSYLPYYDDDYYVMWHRFNDRPYWWRY